MSRRKTISDPMAASKRVIKLPFGQGVWPAFWLLGSDIDAVRWPTFGEFDIMENIGKEPSIIHGTIHGPRYLGGGGLG
jgi:beta-glucanase (GH16 family)